MDHQDQFLLDLLLDLLPLARSEWRFIADALLAAGQEAKAFAAYVAAMLDDQQTHLVDLDLCPLCLDYLLARISDEIGTQTGRDICRTEIIVVSQAEYSLLDRYEAARSIALEIPEQDRSPAIHWFLDHTA